MTSDHTAHSTTQETPLYKALKRARELEIELFECTNTKLEAETKYRADKDRYLAALKQAEMKMSEKNSVIEKLTEEKQKLEVKFIKAAVVANSLIADLEHRWRKYLENLSD